MVLEWRIHWPLENEEQVRRRVSVIREEEGHTGVRVGRCKSRERSIPRLSSDGIGPAFLLISAPKLGVVV